MTKESWLPIPGFEGYEVSSYGRVMTFRGRRKPRLKKLTANCDHLILNLRADGKTTGRYVHRLVLEAFVGPCPSGMECRHLDGNGFNNHLDNLKWGTRVENIADSKRHGTFNVGRGERHGKAKLTAADVIAIREACGRVSLRMLAARYGVSYGHVSKIARGEFWAEGRS